MRTEEEFQEVLRQRDAYSQAMHDLVIESIDMHLAGNDPDWHWVRRVLTGGVEHSQRASLSPERRARLEREAARMKPREKAGEALLKCVGTLQVLDALGRHPQAQAKGWVPFHRNVREALEAYEKSRELLAWMLFPNVAAKPEEAEDA